MYFNYYSFLETYYRKPFLHARVWVSLKLPADSLNKPSTKYVKDFQTPSLKRTSIAFYCPPNKAQQSFRLLLASNSQAHPISPTRNTSCSSTSNLGIPLPFHVPFPLVPRGVTWIFQDVSPLLFSLWIFGPSDSVLIMILIKQYCHILRNLKEFFSFLFYPVPSRNSLRASFVDMWPMQSHKTTPRRAPCLAQCSANSVLKFLIIF